MDIRQQIAKATDEFFEQFPEPKTEDVSETTETVDIYQRDVNNLREESKKFRPRGASTIVTLATHDVIDDGLAHAYKRAKDDSELLRKNGERDRAEMRRQQYMQEYFLPAVEIVANSSSPDELLNNQKALDELDKFALLAGSGKGYTASYIRQAYGNQLGQKQGVSDAYVTSQVRQLNSLLDDGEIRVAVGLARGLREQIDAGERMASDEDYELINKIVTYYD